MSKRMLTLASNGFSAYKIFVPADATPSEKFAGEEFQSFFEQVTGVTLPFVQTSGGRGAEYLFCIGQPPKAREGETQITTDDLGEEGIRIKTEGGRAIITGGRPRGVLYAVYQFLEDYLGCRWFTPDCTRIPKINDLQIHDIDFTYKPCFVYRNCFVYTAFTDPIWAVRNRANGIGWGPGADERFGGSSGHGPAGHSFYALVPPDEYFDKHPEYFSLVNGKRSRSAQLCLSNPDVLKICTDKLREQLRNTKSIGVSFAQNDWLGACECPECRKIDQKYKAYSGSIINFCNKLAEALCDEFPDRLIQTYAYQYGQIPPEGIKVHKNVSVWICSIEACYSHPHGTCDCIRRELLSPDGRNPFFAKDIAGWGKICENLFVWNYDTNFRNFLLPHPNLQVLKKNISFFRDNGVKGVFEQNCTTSAHTEMQELRAYMISKFLWNPDYDENLAMDEFLSAYYSMAAAPIHSYIKLLQDTVKEGGYHLLMSTMPDNPDNREDSVRSAITRSAMDAVLAKGKELPTHGLALYMTPEVFKKSNEIFDRAERLADNHKILDRVRIARMPLRFAEFSVMKIDDPERMEKINSFFSDCSKYGITELKESKPLMESYNACVTNQFIY